MFEHLAPLIAAGTISAPLAATYGFNQVQGSDRESGTEWWQGTVHDENVIRVQVDLIRSADATRRPARRARPGN
jgi:hypothetical protein